MPYKIFQKRKGAKNYKTNKATFLRKADAQRFSKALREKKTHNVRIRILKNKPRNDYWVK